MTSIVTSIVTSLITLALVTVVLRNTSQTSAIIESATTGFSSSLKTAMGN